MFSLLTSSATSVSIHPSIFSFGFETAPAVYVSRGAFFVCCRDGTQFVGTPSHQHTLLVSTFARLSAEPPLHNPTSGFLFPAIGGGCDRMVLRALILGVGLTVNPRAYLAVPLRATRCRTSAPVEWGPTLLFPAYYRLPPSSPWERDLIYFSAEFILRPVHLRTRHGVITPSSNVETRR